MSLRDKLSKDLLSLENQLSQYYRYKNQSTFYEKKISLAIDGIIWREKMISEIDQKIEEWRIDNERFWFRRAITTLAIANAAGIAALGTLLARTENIQTTSRLILEPFGLFTQGLIFAGLTPALLWLGHTAPKVFSLLAKIPTLIGPVKLSNKNFASKVAKLLEKVIFEYYPLIGKLYGYFIVLTASLAGATSALLFSLALYCTWNAISVTAGNKSERPNIEMQRLRKAADFMAMPLAEYRKKYR